MPLVRVQGVLLRTWRWSLGAVLLVVLGLLTWTVPAPAAAPPSPGAQVAVPWRPGAPELGIQLYWVDDSSDGDAGLRARARRALDAVVGLEANAVALSFPFYVTAIDADEVYADDTTPSPERVAAVVREARASGLRVTVRPLLDEYVLAQSDPEDWRGRLAPADRTAWFDSYTAFLEPYLRMAEREGVESFAVGVELSALQDAPDWARVVDAARAVYSGELTYSANWDAYPTAVSGVPVDVVGIDAYPQLDVPPGAGQPALERAWRTWLGSTLRRTPTVLTEVGAAAEAATVDNPADPGRPGAPLDVGIQARWFAAACTAAQDQGVTGLYWWRLPLEVDPAAADPVADRHDSFLGRPAEDAVRECFTTWGRR